MQLVKCNDGENFGGIKLEWVFYYDPIMLQLSSLCFRSETLISRTRD
jgi:hypothetical protein